MKAHMVILCDNIFMSCISLIMAAVAVACDRLAARRLRRRDSAIMMTQHRPSPAARGVVRVHGARKNPRDRSNVTLRFRNFSVF